MESDVLHYGNLSADYLGRERKSRPDQVQHQNNLLLNPAIGWNIALLVSVGLWWGIVDAVSSWFW